MSIKKPDTLLSILYSWNQSLCHTITVTTCGVVTIIIPILQMISQRQSRKQTSICTKFHQSEMFTDCKALSCIGLFGCLFWVCDVWCVFRKIHICLALPSTLVGEEDRAMPMM